MKDAFRLVFRYWLQKMQTLATATKTHNSPRVTRKHVLISLKMHLQGNGMLFY